MILLENGLIIDGTNNEAFKGYVLIEDSEIKSIGKGEYLGSKRGLQIINVKESIICPGFIDIHTHSDICYLNDSSADSKIYQGITTEIIGNCGISSLPIVEGKEKYITEFFNNSLQVKLEKERLESHNIIEYRKEMEGASPVNIGVLIGHGTLRANVAGQEDRELTKKELNTMIRILHKELKNGALGLSLGLVYPPGSYATKEELIAIANKLKEYDRILAVHMRNEGPRIMESVDEMIEIAKATNVHLHISHLKLMGKEQWGKSQELLKKIDNAIWEGLTITSDLYPYDATSTSLAALVPKWAQAGGRHKMIERIKEDTGEISEGILKEMNSRGGANRVRVSGTRGVMPEIEGKTIGEISEKLGLEPLDVVKEVLYKTGGKASAIYHSLYEEDIFEIVKKDYVAIGSDGYALNTDPSKNKTNLHPRNFGTFPRFLKIVKDNKLMSIEEAIYKMTALPARILDLNNRGKLKTGYKADIIVFDLNKVEDNLNYVNSVSKALGIEYVFVNGEAVIYNGKFIDSRPGIVV